MLIKAVVEPRRDRMFCIIMPRYEPLPKHMQAYLNHPFSEPDARYAWFEHDEETWRLLMLFRDAAASEQNPPINYFKWSEVRGFLTEYFPE